MKLIMNFLFLTLIAMTGCSQDEQPTIANDLNLIWSVPSEQEFLASNFPPVIYNDMVIYGWNTTIVENGILHPPVIAYRKNTGEMLWEWNDYLEDAQTWSPWQAKHLHENILTFATTKGNIYAINLDTGETLWRKDFPKGESYIRGFGEYVYYTSSNLDNSTYHIQKGNVLTGEWEIIYTIEQVDEYRPQVGIPSEYTNNDGDQMILFMWTKTIFNPLETKAFLTAYNLTKNELYLEKEFDAITIGSKSLIIKDQKAYFGGLGVQCINLENFEKIWKNSHQGGLGFTGLLMENDILYYGTEESPASLYAVNPETGIQIWKTESSGTSSWMGYHNDIIYFNGGGDGLLHAVDAVTGEELLKKQSPDQDKNNNAFFGEGLSIDPETGRIYTGNYINALCFEPLR